LCRPPRVAGLGAFGFVSMECRFPSLLVHRETSGSYEYWWCTSSIILFFNFMYALEAKASPWAIEITI
jgi:hypothetical protein